jgi:hypothetical protein
MAELSPRAATHRGIDDMLVRVLDTLHLKGPARRLLAKAPEWMTGLGAREIRQRTRLVDADVLEQRFADAIALLRGDGIEIGDYLEFGVYNGTSLACMHRALDGGGLRQSRLFGFDSFDGLPPVAATDSGGHWRPGEFKSSLEFTRRVLDHEGIDWNRVTLVKGFFDATLTPQRRASLGIRKASLIMVDCDLYQSTREALAFCGPAIVDESVIFFDDWFPLADQALGESKAFHEWLTADPTLRARELFDFPFYGKAFLVTRLR